MRIPVCAISVVGLALLGQGCSKEERPAPERVAPNVGAATTPTRAGSTRFVVASEGLASFVIDAPLEKIKGRSMKVRGTLDVDTADLAKSTGEIDVDLDDLKTQTFDDADKNVSQTGHAHNWLELGGDVEAKRREENRWARFTVRSIDEARPANLEDAPDVSGNRVVSFVARGDLWLHGVSAPKSVKIDVTFTGPTKALTGLRIVTAEPIGVSLKEHDVKPRDVAGKFLSGALEKVGKKIDDGVKITLDVKAKPAG